MRKNFVLRNSRKGRGVLPPNPYQWENEHNGLDVRHELGISLDARLLHEDAFALLPNTHVVPHSDLALAPAVANHFSGSNSNRWSAMGVPCPEGDTLVVYNKFHSANRVRSSLMEEFFHLWLGHSPTTLRYYGDRHYRDFDKHKESEAYGSGAASLVPYSSLRQLIDEGLSKREIADHFEVSPQLVEFRIRVTKLSKVYIRTRPTQQQLVG